MSSESEHNVEFELRNAEDRDMVTIWAHSQRCGGTFLSQAPHGERCHKVTCEFPDVTSANEFVIWLESSPLNIGVMKVFKKVRNDSSN
jgi:hypothetical protein